MLRSLVKGARDTVPVLALLARWAIIVTPFIYLSATLYERYFAGSWLFGTSPELVLPIVLGLIPLYLINHIFEFSPHQILISVYAILYGGLLDMGIIQLPFPDWYGFGLSVYGGVSFVIVSVSMVRGALSGGALSFFTRKSRTGERFMDYRYHRGVSNGLLYIHQRATVLSRLFLGAVVIISIIDLLNAWTWYSIGVLEPGPVRETKNFLKAVILLAGIQFLFSNWRAHNLDSEIASDPDFRQGAQELERFKIRVRKTPDVARSRIHSLIENITASPYRLMARVRRRSSELLSRSSSSTHRLGTTPRRTRFRSKLRSAGHWPVRAIRNLVTHVKQLVLGSILRLVRLPLAVISRAKEKAGSVKDRLFSEKDRL